MLRYLYRFGKLMFSMATIAILIMLGACSSGGSSTTTTSSAPALSPTQSTTTVSAPTATILPSTTATPLTPQASPPGVLVSLNVNTSSNAALGDFLVDSKGMTLYYFTKDSINKSTATGAVLASWPIFYSATMNVPASLDAADFATITRDDGAKQTTYKGWPLYFYAKDQAPGDVLGDKVGGIWFVIKVPFYTVMLQTNTALGNYLVDARGMTLYYFTKDSVGKSTATGAVLAAWPVFNAGSFIVPSSINATDFGTITRDDGLKVSNYKGWPLYYYAKDQLVGDTLGQGVGGVWFVINPAAFPPAPVVTPTPTPTTTTTTTTTTTSTTTTPPPAGGGY